MTTKLMAPVRTPLPRIVHHTAIFAMLMASALCTVGAQNAPPPAAKVPVANVIAPPPNAPPPAPARLVLSTVQVAPISAVVMQLKRESAPPDSLIRVSAVDNNAPPTNAVALCSDGTFVVAPNDATPCTPRGGIRALFPSRVLPKPPVPTADDSRRATVSMGRVATAPPASATMQCKDGTFLYGAPSADRCTNNGGLAAIFTHPTPAPARPTRP